MHKKRFFGGIALLALTSSGCGLANTMPERDTMVPAEPTMIDFVDPATVSGLVPRTLPSKDKGSGFVHISYPQLPDAPRLTSALRAETERTLRAFEQATEHAAGPELNVDWQLAAVSPQVVGVRLRTGQYLGAGWGNSTKTLWYDRGTGRATGSTGLLSGQTAVQDLTKQVETRLAERQPGISLTPDHLDSMAFNHDGDLVVEFDDCQVGPCSLGRLAVAVPADQAELSETGRRAREAAREAPRAAIPMTAPTASPDAVSNRAGSVDCATAKCVALTFDDSPGPDTAELLDKLHQAKARATFFTVGGNAAARPDLLRRMSAEGHLVANHTWDHRDLSKLSSSRITDSFGRAEDAVTTAIGETPRLARAPYGAVTKDVQDVARHLGLALVGWDVEGKAQDIPKKVHPGAIVRLRDTGGATVAAIPAVLKKLRGNGYTLVTVPELYGTTGMQAGRLYRSGADVTRRAPLT
ncbi:polysaccharide deacetylase family protein [Nonomuraea rhizosphaerae]|uniref:polysaccharide deacetylase family protein n=1 Tax=Nonomuraea rhizosphaerae TaxID=2665663 RepID=UPI001C5ED435|nr:polysaccharide deacetylase family protein [Nonomuraea rhizosphaerae]